MFILPAVSYPCPLLRLYVHPKSCVVDAYVKVLVYDWQFVFSSHPLELYQALIIFAIFKYRGSGGRVLMRAVSVHRRLCSINSGPDRVLGSKMDCYLPACIQIQDGPG